MEKIDTALAQRVWQRVQDPKAATGPDPGVLTAIIGEALADADACQRLARSIGGKGGRLLELSREDRAQAGCLRGICVLMLGKNPEVHIPAPEPAPAAAMLRQCYAHHLHRVREFDRNSSDPDFGPAFQKLAAEERAHCKTLLELMGSISL